MHFFLHCWDELGNKTGGETTALSGKPKAAAIKLSEMGISQKKNSSGLHISTLLQYVPVTPGDPAQALLSEFVSTSLAKAILGSNTMPDSLLQPLC